MFKAIVICLFLGFVTANEDDLRIIDSIKQEQTCIQAGGLCTIATDCPEGQLAETRGLCPNQCRRGVECCYGVSVKETRCKKRGGDCVEASAGCNPRYTLHNITDCPINYICCVFV